MILISRISSPWIPDICQQKWVCIREYIDSILEFLTILNLEVHHKSRTSPDISSEKITMNRVSEQFDWSESYYFTWHPIAQPSCMFDSKWLQHQIINVIFRQIKLNMSYTVIAMYMVIWLACSAQTFWWWAPTVENLRLIFLHTIFLKGISRKMPLSLWMCLIPAQAKSQIHSSKQVLAMQFC